MAPDKVSVPAPDFCNAPEPDTTPAYVKASLRLNNNVAEFTTLAVAIDPVVEPAPTLTVPAEIVSAPVNVLAPLKVKVPEPVFVKALLPDITPLNVVDELSPPAVNVLAASDPRLIEPAPSIEPTVSLRLARLNVAPDATDTADEFEMRSSADPSASVPTEIVVAPVYEFAPVKVNVPVPVPPLVSAKPPEITPEIVAVVELATCTVALAPRATVPDNVPAEEKFTAPADEAPVPEIVNGSAEVTDPATSSVAPDTEVP